MNKSREHWEKMLPIIQAFVDGHEILHTLEGETRSTKDFELAFSNPVSEYTILPKPIIKWFVICHKTNMVKAYDSESVAMDLASSCEHCRCGPVDITKLL